MADVKLTGFASLPADTFAEGPPAGADISANGRTGPFKGQPVQGFSGVQFAPNSDGSYWFLSDNGFGSKNNSADYLLRIYQLNPDFKQKNEGDGTIEVENFIQFSDPDNLIPFNIVNEDSGQRLLTGADFDIESFVIADDNSIWVGDEFGPFLLHFDSTGKLIEAPIATPNIQNLETLNGQAPLVIGHRGASGSRPEHTLASYRLAIAYGADFIEPDLVATKDGELIARHENALAVVELDDNGNIVFDEDGKPNVTSKTTNVAELDKFAGLLTVKEIDGDKIGGWFSEDFTLSEIKELRARERIPGVRPLNTAFNDEYEIPTFQEVINLVKDVEAETGKKIGIYPETKHPTYFAKEGTLIDGTPINISLSQKLVDTLVESEFTDPDRIFIQSFEIENLIELDKNIMPERGVDIPLVQLLGDFSDDGGSFSVPYDVVYNFNSDNADANPEIYQGFPIAFDENTNYGDLANQEAVNYISTYAEGLGPWKNSFILRESLDTPVDGNGDGKAEITTQLTGEVLPLIEWAHNAGLQVHPYTLRNEERFLTLNPDGTPQTAKAEFEQLIELGVDGFFTDYPFTGDQVRDAVVAPVVRSPQNPDVLFNTLNGQAPLVVAHRGASGELPEHTLQAYRRAIAQGADFIEPDLVITKDGVLIARHEPILDDTTNIAEVFGEERKSTKNLDGEEVTAYFAPDFTLAEIKQLRAVQPRDFRDQSFNGEFEIPTFQEVIELVQEVEAQTGVKVGIYPETKHPTFFDEQGLSLEEPLIATLQETGFTDPSRIFIQSFEVANLLDLQNNLLPDAGLDLPLVQLFGDVEDDFINEKGGGFSVPYDIVANFSNPDFDAVDAKAIYGDFVSIVPDFGKDITGDGIPDTTYQDLATKEIFDYIGETYAEGVGPWKNSFVLRESIDTPVDANGDGNAEITTQLTGEILPYVEWAHDAGMQIHPYTLRNEERYLTLNPDGTVQTAEAEFEQFIELGVDGFFTDFPESGRIAVNQEIVPANLASSRGFEGMAFSPDRKTLYPLLEGAVEGDPDDALRIYKFDATSSKYTGLVGFYQTSVPGHAIGDFTPINDAEFLVIERDGKQGEEAEFKKIFKVDISKIDENGYAEKEEVVDLLNIQDPNDLNNDGETTFDFPFVTIEDVLVIDENTILVANDNNYPFSTGRSEGIDNNEVILLELEESLNLDPRLGRSAAQSEESKLIAGSGGEDLLIAGDNFEGDNNSLFAGSGNDEIDLAFGGSNNRVNAGSGDDVIYVGNQNRVFGGAGNDEFDATDSMGGNRMSGGMGDDVFYLGKGDRALGGEGNDKFFVQSGSGNILSGGAGADQFWIVSGEIPESANTIVDFEVGTDVIGILGLGIDANALTLNEMDGNTEINFGSQTLAMVNGVTGLNIDTSIVFA
ncbi:MAG: glycerophosphodiester phosphodiesterase family protein [Rivularia sp. (in: cyanobacteria)]